MTSRTQDHISQGTTPAVSTVGLLPGAADRLQAINKFGTG